MHYDGEFFLEKEDMYVEDHLYEVVYDDYLMKEMNDECLMEKTPHILVEDNIEDNGGNGGAMLMEDHWITLMKTTHMEWIKKQMMKMLKFGRMITQVLKKKKR